MNKDKACVLGKHVREDELIELHPRDTKHAKNERDEESTPLCDGDLNMVDGSTIMEKQQAMEYDSDRVTIILSDSMGSSLLKKKIQSQQQLKVKWLLNRFP